MEYFRKDSKTNAILFTRDNFDEIRKMTKGNAFDFTIERRPDGACYFSLAVPGHGIQRIYENNYLIFSETGSFLKAVPKKQFEEDYVSMSQATTPVDLQVFQDLLENLKSERTIYANPIGTDSDAEYYRYEGKVEGLDYAICKVEQITTSMKESSSFLPKCNIGDHVHFMDEFYNQVFLLDVTGIIISKGVKGPIYQYNCCLYDSYGDPVEEYEFETDDFDKVVFLNESDAQKMLEKRNQQKMNPPIFSR